LTQHALANTIMMAFQQAHHEQHVQQHEPYNMYTQASCHMHAFVQDVSTWKQSSATKAVEPLG
jgi:hypothetical protein